MISDYWYLLILSKDYSFKDFNICKSLFLLIDGGIMGKMKPKSGQISKKNKKKGSSDQGQFLGQIYQGYTDVR